MAASNIAWMIIVTSTIILTVDADPTCAYEGRKLVCRPADNTDYVLKRGLVSDNNVTLQIVLRECNIIDIEDQAFDNIYEVEWIDLSVNNIQNLKPGVFDGARKLYMLSLANNMLTDIPIGLFSQLTNLRILDLNGNRIHSGLQRGVFDGLPHLYNLYLSDNSILGRDFNPLMFERSNRISTLKLGGNDMSNSPDNLLHTFKKLKKLHIEVCSLSEVPKFATSVNLKTVTTLSMSSNRITRLDDPNTFINLERLEILILSSNGLESVHENVFKGLKKLVDLRLDNNKLKFLPETLFQNMEKLFTLKLEHNLIEFVPDNIFRGSAALRYVDLKDNRFTYLADKYFLELTNSGSKLLTVGFSENPWQCACLMDLINEMKSLGVDYFLYNGKEPECVTSGQFLCRRQREFNQYFIELFNLVKGGNFL